MEVGRACFQVREDMDMVEGAGRMARGPQGSWEKIRTLRIFTEAEEVPREVLGEPRRFSRAEAGADDRDLQF